MSQTQGNKILVSEMSKILEEMQSLPLRKDFWQLYKRYFALSEEAGVEREDYSYFSDLNHDLRISTLRLIESGDELVRHFIVQGEPEDAYDKASELKTMLLMSKLDEDNEVARKIRVLISKHYLQAARYRLANSIDQLMVKKQMLIADFNAICNMIIEGDLNKEDVEVGIGKIVWLKNGNTSLFYRLQRILGL